MAKSNPFRFSTKYQDDETDLLYYGYRYYNASVGKWLSRDPLGEKGGKNLYVCLLNAPLQNVEYLGLGLYKVGSELAPKPSVGTGMGKHGAAIPTLSDSFLYAGLDLASRSYTQRFPNVVKHFQYYLGNSGRPLTIDVQDMVKDSPPAKSHFYNELNDAMAFVEMTASSKQSSFSIVGNWTEGRNNSRDNDKAFDWLHAVGGYNAAGSGQAKMTAICQYSLSFTFNFSDRFRWHPGLQNFIDPSMTKTFDPDKTFIFDDSLIGRLHVVGLAQEFDMIGEAKTGVSWAIGQRYDPQTGQLTSAPTAPNSGSGSRY